MRILIVEDEAMIALNAELSLTAAGHQVIGPYCTRDEAINAAIREKPDIAMVDINLAGHNEGVAIVRDLLKQASVRSIFATGQPAIARDNRDAALGVLHKPYTDTDLVDAFPVLENLIGGGTPPPPRVPKGLELFA